MAPRCSTVTRRSAVALAVRRWAAALAMGACAAVPAHAGLFDDEEARRAILELRQRVEANRAAAEAANQRLAEEVRQRVPEELRQRLTDETAPLRRSLLDLQNQIEALRSEIATLRGQNEQMARLLSDMQQRQKDLAAGLENRLSSVDDRFKRFEPVKVTVDGIEFSVDPAEKRDYDAALTLFRQSNFSGATAAFGGFLARYPASGYAGSAQYWLGSAHYAAREYREAMAAFRALVARDPNHQRVPEALLAIANCQIELKDNRAARKTLEDLLRDHPKAEAAAAARERLARLR